MPGPRATTVPAKSQPRPVCSGWLTSPMLWKTPPATARSTGLTDAAATSTRTWPGPGSSTGTSMISIESGPPGVRTTAVRKVEVLMVSSSYPVSCGCPPPFWLGYSLIASTYPEVRRSPLGRKGWAMPTMTAAQKRAQAKVDYDAFLAGCPSRQLLDRISDKWVALILAALGSGGPHPGEHC